MNIQTILLIAGIVLLVVAVGLAAAAVWVYRRLNIKGVRDDLSGVARVKEIEEAGASGNRARRGSRVRAFSEAAWGGKVSSRREATSDKPTDALTGNAAAGSSHRASDTTTDALTTENSGTDALTTGDAPTDLIDEKTPSKAHSSPPQTPPPRHSSPPGSKARFNFRVVRKQVVCGSPNGIEG